VIGLTGSSLVSRIARDFGSVARTDPFRFALAFSVLLHLALFTAVRWEPLGYGRGRSVPQMHLRLFEEAAAPAVPVVAVAPAPEPSSPPARREKLQDRSGPRAEAAVPQTAANLPPTLPAALDAPDAPAEVAPASAGTRPQQQPAPETLPSAPAAVLAPAASEPVPHQPGAVAPAESQAPPAAAYTPATALGADAAGTGKGSVSAAASSPSAPPGASIVASGPGGPAGNPGGGGPGAAPGGGANGAPAGTAAGMAGRVSPGPHDLAAVRRRIDARKVYPRIAVRNGWEGRVLVEMHLEGDGSLAAVRLLEGSGHTVLDEATITAVRLASPFPPVARVLTVPVEYRLLP
jgi:protein TonB